MRFDWSLAVPLISFESNRFDQTTESRGKNGEDMFALKPEGYARTESEVVDKFCLSASAETFKIRAVCCNDSTSATIRRSLYFAIEEIVESL